MRDFMILLGRDWGKYWAERKINWEKDYTSTWTHPHRQLICAVLKGITWKSLIEIGCGSGANLVKIVNTFKGIQVGGIDINPDAIAAAQKIFSNAILKVGSGEDIFLSDDASDILLTDRTLIYVPPRKIHTYIKELKRVGRDWIILCEFHERNWYKRLKLRLNTGYYAYDYPKLLQKHGFYDIVLYPIPEKLWPGDTYPSFIVKARIPRRK